MSKHLHNVVECPLIQMKNQGSCFQINTSRLKKKRNWMVNNAFCCTLSRPLDSLRTSSVFFFCFFSAVWLQQVLLVSFTPTYVFSYFWLKINSILPVSGRVTSYFFAMDIENKIRSPWTASFLLFWFYPVFFRLWHKVFFTLHFVLFPFADLSSTPLTCYTN